MQFCCFNVDISGAVAGYFSDRISMRPVMVLASIVGAAGMLLFAYSSTLLIAVLGRAVINCMYPLSLWNYLKPFTSFVT